MIRKIICITLFSAATLFMAVSCFDPIFYMISQEVVQEDGIPGDINSMVKFKDNLYLSNGGIYKKTVKPSSETGQMNGQWSASSTDGIKGFVFFLAADSDYIYAESYEFEPDNEDSLNRPRCIRLYASGDAASWTQIDISGITGLGSAEDSFGQGAARIFDNGDDKAYVRLLNGSTPSVYKLNGTSAPSEQISDHSDALGAAGDQFWTTQAVCKSGNKYYFSQNSATLYYGDSTDTSSATSVTLDCGEIQAIAATSDYLLLGTVKGIKRVRLNASGEPESKTADFSNNAGSLLTGIVPMVFVLDPEKPEGQTDEYASMQVGGSLSSSIDAFSETGLYAYYPGRGVWNRDGN